MQTINARLSPVSATAPALARASLISAVVLGAVMQSAEAILVAGLGIGCAAFTVHVESTDLPRYAAASLAVAGFTGFAFAQMKLYGMQALQRSTLALPRVLAAMTLAFAALLIALSSFDLGGGFQTSWLIAWFAASTSSVALGRTTLAARMQSWSSQGRLTRRAVVYGSGQPCQDLLAALAADTNSGIRVCGVYDDRGGERGPDQSVELNHGRLDDLIAFARQSRVDLVLLALPISAETRLTGLLHRLWVLPVDIRLAACASSLRLAPSAYSYVGDVALLALADKPISDWGMIAKSVFDRVIGALALIALSPVMLATAIAIKLDSKGPILFKQKRYGFNNELIEVYKFRSMYTNQTDVNAAQLVTKGDPRVTGVGRVIRKSSLDELPQLFNVLIGNLSLVGPRPHAVSAKAAGKLYGDAVDGYFARHKVKPGITGWAQINGWRGETDTEDKLRNRIEHDLYYIANWSVWFDAVILLKTPRSLIKNENAY